jgi:glutamate dehydrogenase
LDSLWKQIGKLKVSVDFEVQVDIYSEIIKLLRRGIFWFVRNLPGPIEISTAIEFYGESVKELCEYLSEYLIGQAKDKMNTRLEIYRKARVPSDLADSVAILDSGISSLDILLVAHSTQTDKNRVAELYFKVADIFHIDWMRRCIEKQMTESYWNRLSIQALKDDLYDKQRRVVQKIIEFKSDISDINEWMVQNEAYANIFLGFIEKIKHDEEIDINMMILANKQFEIFLRRV